MSLLASLRERRNIGQLSDELEGTRERTLLLQDAAAVLISCIKALALDIQELGTPELKASLDQTLQRLRAEAPVPELAEEIRRRQRETLVYADKKRRYLDDRDEELRHIIGVLTDGLAEVGEGNAAYDRGMLGTGARLEAATQLGDIVKMRQVISREVRDLRKAVADKQAKDAAYTAALTKEVETLRKDVEKARSAAATDPLTGASNRGAFDGEVARLATSRRRAGRASRCSSSTSITSRASTTPTGTRSATACSWRSSASAASTCAAATWSRAGAARSSRSSCPRRPCASARARRA